MGEAATIRAQFAQFQRDLRGRVLSAERQPDIGDWHGRWEMRYQPHRITFGFDWKAHNEHFERLASGAASALLNYRGPNGWMTWLEQVADERLGDVVEVSESAVSGSKSLPITDGNGAVIGWAFRRERKTVYQDVGVVDVVLGSILLCDAIAERASAPAETRLLTVQEAAKFLGVSDDTIRRLQHAKKLGKARVGRRNQVPIADLKAFRKAAEASRKKT
jgi:excisionase family DNA binding protein